MKLLEDHADPTSDPLQGRAGNLGDILAEQDHSAGRRFDKSIEAAQQGGFSGSGTSNDDEEILGVKIETHIVDRQGSGRVALDQISNLKDRIRRGAIQAQG